MFGTASREEDDESAAELEQERAGRYLADVERRIRDVGFRGRVEGSVVATGNVVKILVRRLRDTPADLVALSTHGRGPVKRAWLGSVADGLLRHSPVPILMVRPEEPDEDATRSPKDPLPDLSARAAPVERILFPLDGSSEAERMLELAAPLADARTAECLLFRVVDPSQPGEAFRLGYPLGETARAADAEKAAAEYLEGCSNVRAIVTAAAQPAVAILDAATGEEVNLIAIATAGRGGIARLLLGSVADKVIRGSPVPVLVACNR
jgi:nucleotide-binding universal stress UspA family protein